MTGLLQIGMQAEEYLIQIAFYSEGPAGLTGLIDRHLLETPNQMGGPVEVRGENRTNFKELIIKYL